MTTQTNDNYLASHITWQCPFCRTIYALTVDSCSRQTNLRYKGFDFISATGMTDPNSKWDKEKGGAR